MGSHRERERETDLRARVKRIAASSQALGVENPSARSPISIEAGPSLPNQLGEGSHRSPLKNG